MALARSKSCVRGYDEEDNLRIKDNRIEDIKFRTFGCGAAIATSSMVTELVKGLTLEEALEVSNKQVAESLGGLPPQSCIALTWRPKQYTLQFRITTEARD